jgi:hypothetical protein
MSTPGEFANLGNLGIVRTPITEALFQNPPIHLQ